MNDEAKQPFLAERWPPLDRLARTVLGGHCKRWRAARLSSLFAPASVPEVIDEGVSGFVVDDEEQAVQAVKRLANSIGGGGCASGSRNASRQDGWP